MLYFVARHPQARHLKQSVSHLESLAESCSRQIRAWADSLQNSEIKGPRYLTDETRRQDELEHRREEFMRRIAKILHETHPHIYPDPDAS